VFCKTTDSSPMWANTLNNLKDWNPDGITRFSSKIVISSINKRKYDHKSHRWIMHETRHICKIIFRPMEQNKPKNQKQTNKQMNLTISFYKFLYAPRIKTSWMRRIKNQIA
jgi:hypothetical protein